MKIALYSGPQQLCVLDGGEVPADMHPHQVAHEIVDFFRDGHWVWVNKDKKAIRYESITAMEILPDTPPEYLSEKAPAD